MSVLPLPLGAPAPLRVPHPRWRRLASRCAAAAVLALVLLLPAARAGLWADHERYLLAQSHIDEDEERLCRRLDDLHGLPAPYVLDRLGIADRAYRVRGTLIHYVLALKFIDRATGEEFRLYFKEDRLTTWGLAPRRAPWRWEEVWDDVERARWVGTAVFLFLWLVALLAALGAWRFHRRPGRALLGLAALVLLYARAEGRFGSEVPWLRFLPPHACCLRLVALSAAVWALPVHIRRRARGAGPPRCGKCKYDLTGNESGVCPECGTVVSNLAFASEAGKLAEMVSEPVADEETLEGATDGAGEEGECAEDVELEVELGINVG